MPTTTSHGQTGGFEPPDKLAFTFRLAGGTGKLTLGQRQFFGWLHLDQLELEVPNLRLPVDLAIGAEAFQRHRTRARIASLRMEQHDLDHLVSLRRAAVEDLGVEELRIRFADGALCASARVREGGQVAELTARIHVDFDHGRIRFAIGRSLIYGYLPTPAPLLAHRILSAILGRELGDRVESAPTGTVTSPITAAGTGAGTGRWEMERDPTGGPWSRQVRGLGEVELDPLALTLWHILPHAGWRLPDTRGLVIADLAVGPKALMLSYRSDTAGPAEAAGDLLDSTSLSPRGPELLQLYDAIDRLREPDARLAGGDIDGAMRLYRSRLSSYTDEEPYLLERMLAVSSARRELFDECTELAARALARWPDFAASQAALASIAVARGDAAGAGARYRTLSAAAGAAGDREAAEHAALAAARLLRRSAPADSTPLYERVLELDPGHPEAIEALADRYKEERRFADLVRLLRARAASATDMVRRARDHVRVAHILVRELSDPAAARRELDAATRLDPHSPAAHEVLADIEAALDRPLAGADALERAARLYSERRDRRGQSRALLRAAMLCDAAGEETRAEAVYSAVLELSPGEPAALRGAARAATRRGEHAAAARTWRQLVSLSAGSPVDAARDSLELARALLAGAGPGQRAAGAERSDAEAALRRAAASSAPLVAADAHQLLVDLAREDQRTADAIVHLGHAIDALSLAAQGADAAALRRRGASLSLTRADLLARSDSRPTGVPPSPTGVPPNAGAKVPASSDDWRDAKATGPSTPVRGAGGAAVAEYERAFALSDEGDPVRLAAARALAAAASEQRDPIGERTWIAAQLAHPGLDLDRGPLMVRRAELALMANEDLAAALGDLDRAEKEELPAELAARALRLRADVLGRLGDGVGAARALDRAFEAGLLALERIELAIAAARAYLDLGESKTALARARSAVDTADGASRGPAELRRRALEMLGEAAWRARDFAAVELAYGELLASGHPAPERAEWAHRLGAAREDLGRAEAAAAAYELVIAEPSVPIDMRVTTWRQLAALYEHTADLARAALAYESLAADGRSRMPDQPRAEAWYRAGDLYRKTGGREEDALRCLEAALGLSPDHLPALDVLERLARDADDAERLAVILSRKIAATARQPGSQKSLLCRLAALQEEKLGRTDVAREIYHRALAIDPDYRPALRFAARDARASGQVDDAIRLFRKLSSALPGDPPDGGAAGDALADERAAAALELAALAAAEPTPERTDAAAAAIRENLEAQPHKRQLADCLRALDSAAAPHRGDRLGEPDEDALTSPRGHDPYSELVDRARVAMAAGEAETALATLEPIERAAASPAVLEIRADAADALGDPDTAVADLEALAARAAASESRGLELRATRRLAALIARRGDDDRRAVELFQRVLSLDPDNLAAAEACAEIFSRRRELDLYRAALVRVLEVVRRTGAGHQREIRALRELAWTARSQGDLAAAAEHLETACSREGDTFEALRERADLAAETGDPEAAARWLETLGQRLEQAERAGERSFGPATVGEIYLELADLYYDQIDDVTRARDAMRRAAESFGKGARRDATLRLLASEAAAAGAPSEAATALEEIGPDRLSPGDRLTLAKCYQRLGRDHRAIELLDRARSAGILSDEGALLLFALGRHRKQKADLAASLERNLKGAPAAVATARLSEALELYRGALDDEANAKRVAELIARIERGDPLPDESGPPAGGGDAPGSAAPGGANTPAAPATESGINSAIDLSLAEAAGLELKGARDAAAARYEALWAQAPADPRPLEALERLYLERGDAEAVSEVIGRMIVATEDRRERAALWYRRAKLYRDLLRREPEAYRCLKEAFANHPESGDISHALRAVAMVRGEWGLAGELVYREIAAAGDDHERAALYNELALIFDEKLLDADQAIRCYEQALALDPFIPAAPRPLARLYELKGRHRDAAAMYERAAGHTVAGLDRVSLLRLASAAAERGGASDEARQLGDSAAALAAELVDPDDPDAAFALPRAATSTGRLRVLQARLGRTKNPEVAGNLHRQIIELATAMGDDTMAVRHAGALLELDRADLSAFLTLKNQATTQGNWRTLADLLQSRAAAVEDLRERADLLVDLGRLYERQVGDPDAAVAAFEQAVAAAPDHASAIEALAELAYGRSDWLRARELYGRLDPHTTSLAPDLLYLRQGEVSEMLGEDHEACAAFTEAVRQHPTNRQALTALSRTALRIGDLDSAISAARSLLELLPPEDVRAVRAARLQLAELCQRAGEVPGAIGLYEQVLREEPRSITALSSLLLLYGDTGNHQAGARVLRSLIGLTPAPAQRAELLFRLGELYRTGLADPDEAADSYLKAIDLDPDHLPTLRRLLEYYWRTGDQKNLLDVAADLASRAALADPAIDPDLLGGVVVIAALRDLQQMAVQLTCFLGAAAPAALASALVLECSREGAPLARNLAATANEVCRAAGLDPLAVRAELQRRSGGSEPARKLAQTWPPPR